MCQKPQTVFLSVAIALAIWLPVHALGSDWAYRAKSPRPRLSAASKQDTDDWLDVSRNGLFWLSARRTPELKAPRPFAGWAVFWITAALPGLLALNQFHQSRSQRLIPILPAGATQGRAPPSH